MRALVRTPPARDTTSAPRARERPRRRDGRKGDGQRGCPSMRRHSAFFRVRAGVAWRARPTRPPLPLRSRGGSVGLRRLLRLRARGARLLPRRAAGTRGLGDLGFRLCRFDLGARRHGGRGGSSICTTPTKGYSAVRRAPREPRRNRTPKRTPLSRPAPAPALPGLRGDRFHLAGGHGRGRRLGLSRRQGGGCRGLCRQRRERAAPARRDLVLILAHLPNVRDLGVVGLPQEPWEARRIEERILPPVECRHPETQRLVAHRPAQLGQRLGHELEGPCERSAPSAGRARRARRLTRRRLATALRPLAAPVPVRAAHAAHVHRPGRCGIPPPAPGARREPLVQRRPPGRPCRGRPRTARCPAW